MLPVACRWCCLWLAEQVDRVSLVWDLSVNFMRGFVLSRAFRPNWSQATAAQTEDNLLAAACSWMWLWLIELDKQTCTQAVTSAQPPCSHPRKKSVSGIVSLKIAAVCTSGGARRIAADVEGKPPGRGAARLCRAAAAAAAEAVRPPLLLGSRAWLPLCRQGSQTLNSKI